MEAKETLEFDVNSYAEQLVTKYLTKLNHDDVYISTMNEIIETLDIILQKNKVHSQSIEWDREGVNLIDGKAVVPKGMEKVLKEIVEENLLYSFFLPEKFGGLGTSGFMIGPLTEKLASFDISCQMIVMMGFTILEPLLIYYKPESDKVIEEFASGKRIGGYVAFTEPQAGSNLKAVKSTSEKVGDEFVLNGTKIFVSNGGYSETGLFLAQNNVNGKAEGTNVFLVDSLQNIDVVRLEEKSGLHANPTAQLQFENVTVSENNLIATRGKGYEKVLERLLGMRISVAFQGVAAAKRAYQLSYNYATVREQFDKPIIQFDGVRRKLKGIKNQIQRLDDYCYRAAYAFNRYLKGWVPSEVGADGKSIAEKTAAEMVPDAVKGGLINYFASSAKIYTTEIANNILYDAQQIFGGNGFMSEFEINKITRDIRVLPIYEGTSEIHHWILRNTQKAIAMLPRFKKPYSEYEGTTIYERYLFDRYPGLQDLI